MVDLGSEMRIALRSAAEHDQQASVVLTTADLAECTCPEFCERDHDVD